jgi:hypothetical protein
MRPPTTGNKQAKFTRGTGRFCSLRPLRYTLSSQCTCVPGTKAQKLTRRKALGERGECEAVIKATYWFKSTNNDAEGVPGTSVQILTQKARVERGECEALIRATEDVGFSFWHPHSDRKDYRSGLGG